MSDDHSVDVTETVQQRANRLDKQLTEAGYEILRLDHEVAEMRRLLVTRDKIQADMGAEIDRLKALLGAVGIIAKAVDDG